MGRQPMNGAGRIGLAPPTPEKGANLQRLQTFSPRILFRGAPHNPHLSRVVYGSGRILRFTSKTTCSSYPWPEVPSYQLLDDGEVQKNY